MEDETVTPETTNEPVEETEETPATDTSEETPETPEVDVAQVLETNKKLFERAKKAEAEVKMLKGNKTTVKPSTDSPQPNVEETVLLANGMPEELVKELKVVAKARGITSLLKAQKDPIFVAIKEKFEKDTKTREASVGGSNRAGAKKAQKNFTTPGLSRDEHRAMVLGQ